MSHLGLQVFTTKSFLLGRVCLHRDKISYSLHIVSSPIVGLNFANFGKH